MEYYVSVCSAPNFDEQYSLAFKFDDERKMFEFLKLSLSQGYICLVEAEELEVING